nr:phosphatidylinositol N-acetylglucosaminyltransferase subunit H-like [Lytechinus pictus]
MMDTDLKNDFYHAQNVKEDVQLFLCQGLRKGQGGAKWKDDQLVCEISVTAKQSKPSCHIGGLLHIFFFMSAVGLTVLFWNAVLAIMISVLLFLYIHSSVSKETLLLISSLGLQISSEYVTGCRVTQFIPFRAVQDIVIHEAVTMNKVVYYLAVLLKHQNGKEWTNSLVPVFMHSMPRLDKLQEIHASVHRMWDFEKNHLESSKAGGDNCAVR